MYLRNIFVDLLYFIVKYICLIFLKHKHTLQFMTDLKYF
jgi:hypothetical protein